MLFTSRVSLQNSYDVDYGMRCRGLFWIMSRVLSFHVELENVLKIALGRQNMLSRLGQRSHATLHLEVQDLFIIC